MSQPLSIVSNCPKCGAPVYGNATVTGPQDAKAVYSCVCPRPGPSESTSGGNKPLFG